MSEPVVLTEKQKSALLIGTMQQQFTEAIALAGEARAAGINVVLHIEHKKICTAKEPTMYSRFDVIR